MCQIGMFLRDGVTKITKYMFCGSREISLNSDSGVCALAPIIPSLRNHEIQFEVELSERQNNMPVIERRFKEVHCTN